MYPGSGMFLESIYDNYLIITNTLPMIGRCLAFPPKPLIIPKITRTRIPKLKIGNNIQPKNGIILSTMLPIRANKNSSKP